ncbi:MAG: sigma-70 family RNA polymerase sigma factor [Saprospiraceae bacterium]|nr:sigma-70 family RNA polymerase sigma factor [Saprospiraceae bacterium]
METISSYSDPQLLEGIRQEDPKILDIISTQLWLDLNVKVAPQYNIRDYNQLVFIRNKALFQLWKRVKDGKYKDEGKLMGFAFGILRNVAKESRRPDKRPKVPIENAYQLHIQPGFDTPPPVDFQALIIDTEAVPSTKLLKWLASKQKQDQIILTRYFYHNENAEQIATSLNLDPERVKVRLSQLKAQMKNLR